MTVTKGPISSRALVVLLCCSSMIASGRTYQTQPLIFALRNYYGQSAANAYAKTERRVEEEEEEVEDEDEDYEYEDEYDDYEPPRIVWKPLIVVLMEGLMSAGSSLIPRTRAESSSEEAEVEQKTSPSPSVLKDALAVPFKLLQEYGMSALSSYFPAIEQLKSYGRFYENWTRASNAATEAELKQELKEEVTELVEDMKKDPTMYERFSVYFPYAIITLKLGSYFVPALGQAKTLLVGLEIIRISWRTASMYNKGDSFSDIYQGLGKDFVNAAIGRRAELEPLTTPSTMTAFVELSSMDVDTFLKLVKESRYPPLKNEDEAALREDVTDVVNSYFGDEGLTPKQKMQTIATIEKVSKFIALHAIIPALANKSGDADPK